MATRRSESELANLRRLARQAARRRKERVTTVHLLAALCTAEGPAHELLRARGLDEQALLRAGRTFDEPGGGALDESLAAAKDLAKRSAYPASERASVRGPGAIHVLVVLLSNRHSAAYRALSQCGVDVARLRTAATQIAFGSVAPPRAVRSRTEVVTSEHPAVASVAVTRTPAAARPASSPSSSRRPKPTSRRAAVEVPLIPPSSGRATRQPAAKVLPSVPKEKARPRRKTTVRKAAARSSSAATQKAPSKVASKVASKAASRKPTRTATRANAGTANAGTTNAGTTKHDALQLNDTTFPTLAALGINLTLEAARGELDRVVGRESEIEQALDVLAKRRANSPLLVGPPGVGKTSVAHGLAHVFAEQYRAAGELRWLIELPITDLLSGTAARGSLAERLAAVRGELRVAGGRIVLFIDELHEMLAASGGDELVAELKAALAKGEFPLIATTTAAEYRRMFDSDAALARRFSVVEIDEPDEADSFLVLRAVCGGLSKHHGAKFSDEAIASSVAWSLRYLPGRALPDKAVSVLDLAAARLKRRTPRGTPEVVPEHIAEVVSELADVPIERLLQTDGERMLELDKLLSDRIVGHPEEAKRIAAVLRRNAAGLRGRRPIGSFLLLGPTGVGKTETAKAVAEILFHSPDAMTRLDLSEYSEAHAVARLIGAPPGYIGHDAGGTLTEAVCKRPYQVILLDEFEKAHRDVLQSFLQVFDEGRLTDGRGRTVDFSHTVIVMTANLGASEIDAACRQQRVGFAGRATPAGGDESELRDIANRAARAKLPPELYNRIDEIMYYSRLERPHVAQIAERLIADLAARIAVQGVRLDVDPAVVDRLLDRGGFDPSLGARPLRRAIARLLEAPLAEMLLRGEATRGSVVMVVSDGDGIGFDVVDPARQTA
jgi:ATP-dependent Clp protease ATP-binding subunit ClpC